MRKLFLSLFACLLLTFAFAPGAFAQGCSVTSISLTSTGSNSSTCFVPAGQPIAFAITGTWVGTATIYYSENAGLSYTAYLSVTANQAATIASANAHRLYRITFDSRTSGTVTGSLLGLNPIAGRNIFTTVPVGLTTYGSAGSATVTPVAGTWYIGDVDVAAPGATGKSFTVTAIDVLNGATVGTNKYIFALVDGSGQTLGNTTTSGVLTAGADAFQEIALAANVTIPPGHYYIAVQMDGTTDRMRLQTTNTFVNTQTTSTTGTFATVPTTFTPPTTFTTNTGPIAYLKGSWQ